LEELVGGINSRRSTDKTGYYQRSSRSNHHPLRNVREGAVEALAVSTEDEDWRPNELIRQGGIEIIAALLHDKNKHIVVSAPDIIIATATAGEEEALIEGGMIDVLDRIQDHKDPLIRKKAQEALWLLVPGVEEVVTSKTQDDY
jgi:hypothetical protein